MYSLLLADDEPLERKALRLISNKNCPGVDRILEATNGKQALDICRYEKPDIVFLDVRMPGLSGLEAARELRKIRPEVRIVFLTAYDQFDYAHEAIRIGVDDFLLKPASDVRVTEVIDRVTAILDGNRRREEALLRGKDKLEKVTELFTSEILASLLERPVSPGTLKKYFEVMDIPFSGGVVAAFRIDYSSYPMKIESAEQRLLLKRRSLLKIQNEFEGRMIRCLVHELEEVFYVLILPGRDAALEYTSPVEISDLFQSITALVKSDLGMQVRAGISRGFSDPEEIHGAFLEAGSALERPEPGESVSLWQDPPRPAVGIPQPRSEVLVRDVVLYIRENYMKDVSLETMAARVKLSSFYFSKMFKQHTGTTFIDYLTGYRIERARQLLRDPRVNVKEVSPAVGYPDPNYFARVFKRIVGIPPTEFRDRKPQE